MNVDYTDEAAAVERLHDEEQQAVFLIDSDRLETLFRDHVRDYQRLGLGWPSIGRVITSVMDWPDFRENGDTFVAEIRQFGHEYGWAPVWHCYARAMEKQQQAA